MADKQVVDQAAEAMKISAKDQKTIAKIKDLIALLAEKDSAWAHIFGSYSTDRRR